MIVTIALICLISGATLGVIIYRHIPHLETWWASVLKGITEHLEQICLCSARFAWKLAVKLDHLSPLQAGGIAGLQGPFAVAVLTQVASRGTGDEEGEHMRTRIPAPDGKRAIILNDGTQTVELLDVEHQITLCSYRGYAVTSVSWSPDSTRVALGSPYRTVRIWDASSGKLLATRLGQPEAHRGLCRVVSLKWSADGSVIASASPDGMIQVWDANTGEIRCETQIHHCLVVCLCWSPEMSRIASASMDGIVALWDTGTGELISRWECPVQVHQLIWQGANALLVESANTIVQRIPLDKL